MKDNRIFLMTIFLLLLFAMVYYSCRKDMGTVKVKATPTLCDSLNITYSIDISNIMQNYCVSCHYTAGPNTDLSNYAGVQAQANNGNLYVKAIGPNADMPQGGPPLADSLKRKLECWINAGAPNN